MRRELTTRISTLAIFLTVCCSHASGERCEPEWDTTVGNPGVPVSEGSIQSLLVFDDGTGEMLYAGGGFSSVAGQPGTSNIARWDRDSNTWSGLDGGIVDGGPRKMVSFDAGGGPELVVCGRFPGTVSGVPYTANIAKWNGSEWSALGTGIPGEFVYAMTTWDGVVGNRLYVGGRFPTAGGVTANGIAAWDGTQWHSMGDGITGWNPYVESMVAWDDGSGEKLYAAGRFDTMDGLYSPLIARWDGETWEKVGDGLINDMYLFGIESMAVHDDGSGPALYVGGYEFHAPGQPVGKVSKWDGQQWTTVGGLGDGVITDLCTFDDGNGPGLYRTGRSAPGWKYFARLVDGQWEIVGGGIWKDPFEPWPAASSLCAWDDALYVCGYFNLVGDIYTSNCIAAWGCPACPGDVDGDGDTDHSDLGELLAAWCTHEGDPNWNPNADLDGDGHVGHGDLGILLADWGCGT
ncbi:MAG TPA: hypothetical protein VMY37_05185 [Thermoguttaceae bacterium]|nr:hypothetical protein [Thermoguttaceae bacterium]